MSVGEVVALSIVLSACESDPLKTRDKLSYRDDFEESSFQTDLWNLKQVLPDRAWVDDSEMHHGKRSAATKSAPGDVGDSCEPNVPCQRTEVRETNAYRIKFGTPSWYGLSFKVTGEYQTTGSIRWVVGQWKDESGGSPFLAQRFDNGVFHITVESNGCRVLIAAAYGDPDALKRAQNGPQTRDYSAIDALPFLTEKERYKCASDVKVTQGEAFILPSPYDAWVDMAYYLKGGVAGEGQLEVFANGKSVATATGTLGHDAAVGKTQYFKFGQYRDVMPGTSISYWDCIARGKDRANVDPVTVCK